MVKLKKLLKTSESDWYKGTITRYNHIEILKGLSLVSTEPAPTHSPPIASLHSPAPDSVLTSYNGGKLLIQSNLDIASTSLSKNLHDLDLLIRSGVLDQSNAVVLSQTGPGSENPLFWLPFSVSWAVISDCCFEYAFKAVKAAADTSIGVRGKDSVYVITQRKHKLLDQTSFTHPFLIIKYLGSLATSLTACYESDIEALIFYKVCKIMEISC
ncbi:hypothetical protein Ddye_020103 [Dipteronia dyeriana]|uniref:DUF7032 domain-containing protein n=1 Tax=Dipteronia dyeriana TaxID=168575 RepID=A0AAD9TZK4_9ROSI|nr:hypothetical protein Ddye_020103 [Dipteronia dyeriana]